jgi:hypothetical protein
MPTGTSWRLYANRHELAAIVAALTLAGQGRRITQT